MPRDTIKRAKPSGRFVLRLTPELHASLRLEAGEARLSLNEYCARKLGAPAANVTHVEGAAAAVQQSTELFGDKLMAVIAYGSWARGDAMSSSDVDLLIVLSSSAPVTRELYRRWDAKPLMIETHSVEPHFVQMRSASDAITGLWAEAALEGILFYERGLEVSRRLLAVRRDVIEGRLVRRIVHGQPYWAEVA